MPPGQQQRDARQQCGSLATSAPACTGTSSKSWLGGRGATQLGQEREGFDAQNGVLCKSLGRNPSAVEAGGLLAALAEK